MSEALTIFVAGIAGVFLAMALLYTSTKITAGVVTRWFPEKVEK
jgi:Na+-transporting methylmalonyl-CoA/oxaloacetate decarboxylase gamma subunit